MEALSADHRRIFCRIRCKTGRVVAVQPIFLNCDVGLRCFRPRNNQRIWSNCGHECFASLLVSRGNPYGHIMMKKMVHANTNKTTQLLQRSNTGWTLRFCKCKGNILYRNKQLNNVSFPLLYYCYPHNLGEYNANVASLEHPRRYWGLRQHGIRSLPNTFIKDKLYIYRN